MLEFFIANNFEKNILKIMKKIFFSNKIISDGSIFLATKVAIANTFTDGISDCNIIVANNFEKDHLKNYKKYFF